MATYEARKHVWLMPPEIPSLVLKSEASNSAAAPLSGQVNQTRSVVIIARSAGLSGVALMQGDRGLGFREFGLKWRLFPGRFSGLRPFRQGPLGG